MGVCQRKEVLVPRELEVEGTDVETGRRVNCKRKQLGVKGSTSYRGSDPTTILFSGMVSRKPAAAASREDQEWIISSSTKI